MKRVFTHISALFVIFVLFVTVSSPVQAQLSDGVESCDENCLQILDGPSNETFDTLNPLPTEMRGELSSPGGILTRLLNFAFPIAGVILFLMLLWSGFEILTKATDKNAVSAGAQRATAAVIGFVLLFCSYWFMQILEFIFGIHIL